MRLYELLDPNLLKDHEDNRRVSSQRHPTLPIRIYNYTHLAQFDPHWGDGTIDWCRGLIVDDDYNIVSLPFRKFHNLNTASISETMFENLPRAPYSATEKLDGSLGIFYDDGCGGAIATRGSFTSPQAIFATKWFKENIWNFDRIWTPDETPLFEIIYPENRIVVDYKNWGGLIAIGMMNKNTGAELPWPFVKERFSSVMRCAHDWSGTALHNLINLQRPNEEGFVVTFSTGLKVKIKMEEYKRLHRIVTGMNPHTVWEYLRDGKELPSEGLPANFKKWLTSWQLKLESEFTELYWEAKHVYMDRPVYDGIDPRSYRAAFAAYIKREAKPKIHGILFAMLDGKDVTPYIWDLLEPRGDDKSFRTEGE